MRHRNKVPKLGRTAAHRDAMLRNLTTDLLRHERVRTTLARAKAVRPVAERMVTLGKRDTLHARRRAARLIRDPLVVRKLFEELAPRYAERPGGYTRIFRLTQRAGDRAEMAIIELVEASG
ncbi:MAG: 50S ribosomal protein L17 [Acidobacteriota bacterium]